MCICCAYRVHAMRVSYAYHVYIMPVLCVYQLLFVITRVFSLLSFLVLFVIYVYFINIYKIVRKIKYYICVFRPEERQGKKEQGRERERERERETIFLLQTNLMKKLTKFKFKTKQNKKIIRYII